MSSKFTFNIQGVMGLDVTQTISSVNKAVSAISKIKVPGNVTADLGKMFVELNKQLQLFESRSKSGFKNIADVRNLNNDFKTVQNLISTIDKEIVKLTGKKLDLNLVPEFKSATTELAKLTQNGKDFARAITAAKQEIKGLSSLKGFNLSKELFSEKAVNGSFLKTIKDEIASTQKELDKFISQKNSATAKMGAITRTSGVKGGETQSQQAEYKALIDVQQKAQVEIGKLNTKMTELGKAKGIIVGVAEEFKRLGQADASKKITELSTAINNIKADGVNRLNSALKESSTSLQGVKQGFNSFAPAVQQINQAAQAQTEFNRELDMMQNRIAYVFSITNGFYLMRQAIQGAYKSVTSLDKAMTEIAVVTDMGVGDLWAQREDYAKLAGSLGTTTLGAFDVAKLYYQQGLDNNEVTAATGETLKFARISGLEYADATDYMTAALRGFKLEMTDVGKVNDIYSSLAARTASSQQEIAEAVTRTASIAKSAGMELESTSAFLAQMIETTREAPENLGTAMKTIVARFQELKKAPSEIEAIDGEIIDANKVDKALRSIGISLKDNLTGQFRDLDDVFLEISAKWDGLDRMQQRYIATIAAGSRQQSRFIAMMDNYERTVELMGFAYNSAGDSQQQFEKTLDSLESKANQLKNAWEQFILTLANSDVIKGVVDLLTGLLTNINNVSEVLGPFGGIFQIALIALGLKAGKSLGTKILAGVATSLKGGAAVAGAKVSAEFGTGMMNGFANVKNQMKTVFNKEFWIGSTKPMQDAISDIIKQKNLSKVFNDTNKLAQGLSHAQGQLNSGRISSTAAASGMLTMNDKLSASTLKLTTALGVADSAQISLYSKLIAMGIPAEQAMSVLIDKKTGAIAAEVIAMKASEGATEESTRAELKNMFAQQQNATMTTIGMRAKAQQAVQILFSTKAIDANSIAVTKNASAQKVLAAVSGKGLGWIGLAIAGLVTLAIAVDNYNKAMSNTQKLSDLTAVKANLTEQGLTIKENINALEEYSSSIEDAKIAMSGLTKGSVEWNKAMLEGNRTVLDLAKQVPSLYKLIKIEGGLFTLSKESLEQEIAVQVTLDLRNQQQILSSDIGINQINQDMLSEDISKTMLKVINANALQPVLSGTGTMVDAAIIAQIDRLSNGVDGAASAAEQFALSVTNSVIDFSDLGEVKKFLQENAAIEGTDEQVEAFIENLPELRRYGTKLNEAGLTLESQTKLLAESTIARIADEKKIEISSDYAAFSDDIKEKIEKANQITDYDQSRSTHKVADQWDAVNPNDRVWKKRYVELQNEMNGADSGKYKLEDNGDIMVRESSDALYEEDKNLTLGEVQQAVRQINISEGITQDLSDKMVGLIAAEDKLFQNVEKASDGILGRLKSGDLEEKDLEILSEAVSEAGGTVSKFEESLNAELSSLGLEGVDLQLVITNFIKKSDLLTQKLAGNMVLAFEGADGSQNQLIQDLIVKLTTEQKTFLNEIGPRIYSEMGQATTKQFYNMFSALGTDSLKQEVMSAFEGLDFDDPINSMSTLVEISKTASTEVSAIAKNLLSSGKNFYSAQKQFKALKDNQEEWKKITSQVKKFRKESGKLSSANIKTMRGESELLDTVLNNLEMSAVDAAWAVEGLSIGSLAIEGLTEDVLKAVSTFNQLETVIAETGDYWANFNAGTDEGAIDDSFFSLTKKATELFDGGEFGNSQLENIIIGVFGLEAWNKAVTEAGGELDVAQQGFIDKMGGWGDNAYGMFVDMAALIKDGGGLLADGSVSAFTQAGLKVQEDGSIYFDTLGLTTKEWIKEIEKLYGLTPEAASVAITSMTNHSPDMKKELGTNDYKAGMDEFFKSKQTETRWNPDKHVTEFTGLADAARTSDAEIMALANRAMLLNQNMEEFYETMGKKFGVSPEVIASITTVSDLINAIEPIDLVDESGVKHDIDTVIAELKKGLEGREDEYLTNNVIDLDTLKVMQLELNPDLSEEEFNATVQSLLKDFKLEGITPDLEMSGVKISQEDLTATGGSIASALETQMTTQNFAGVAEAITKGVGKEVATKLANVLTGVDENGEPISSTIEAKVEVVADEAKKAELQSAIDTAVKDGGTNGVGNIDFSSAATGLQTSLEGGAYKVVVDAQGKITSWTTTAAPPTAATPTAAPLKGGGDAIKKPKKGSNNATGARAATGARTYSSKYPRVNPGPVLTGEEAPELVQTKDGYYMTGLNGPEMIDIEKGDIIYNGDDTKKILGGREAESGPRYAIGFRSPKSQNLGTRKKNQEIKAQNQAARSARAAAKQAESGVAPEPEDIPELWENGYDWLYNLLININKELRVREKLERTYGRILKDNSKDFSDLYRNTQKQLESLDKQKQQQLQLQKSRTKEVNDVMAQSPDLQQYGTFDQASGKMQINWDLINSVTDKDQGAAIEAYISKLEEMQAALEEAEDTLLEIEDQVDEIRSEGEDSYLSLEQTIYDALVERDQQIIDKISSINDVMTSSNAKLISAMQKNLDKDREKRDQDEEKTDIEEKQRRLALLKQDTGGSNALEIYNLEKDIKDQQQSYTDSLIDKAIAELQEQNDIASENRQLNIESLQNQLDWRAENGIYWSEVNELMTAGPEAIKNALASTDAFLAMSKVGMADWWDNTQTQYKEALTWWAHSQGDIGNLSGQTIDFIDQDGKQQRGTVQADGSVKDASGNVHGKVIKMPNGSFKSVGDITKPATAPPTPAPITTPSDGVVPKREGDLDPWGRPFPFGRASDTAARDLSAGMTGEDVKAVQWALQSFYGEPDVNGTFDENTRQMILHLQNVSSIPATGAVDWQTRLQFGWHGFKKGGLADYTGPAWLDGTPTKPEMVLNARDTENFIQLKDILANNLGSPLIGNQKSGDTYVEVHIEVDELANDYDVEKLADKVKRVILTDGQYRNNNIIGPIR